MPRRTRLTRPSSAPSNGAMKRVRQGRYVSIPAGPKTHGHFTHFYAEVWKPHLIEFMRTLGTPLDAAAE